MRKPFTFVDLFSGAGGFTEGMLLAGKGEAFRLVAASDIHENAEKTHTHRFREQIGIDYGFLTMDIREDEYQEKLLALAEEKSARAEVDIVVGGPPCQGYSVFGARNEQDPRNDLFRPYLRMISALRPKYFVMENVPGLAQMYKGKAVEGMYAEVAKINSVKYVLKGPIFVNSAQFGVPQSRERIIFIGSRSDCPIVDKILNDRKQNGVVTVEDAIGDLSFLKTWEKDGRYHPQFGATTRFQRESRRGRLFKKLGITVDGERLHNHEAAEHSPEVIARFAMMEPGGGFESIPARLWEAHLQSSKKWCIRLDGGQPAYTITTLPDDFVHYKQHRILTVREAARLQSFDDTYVFQGPRASGGGGKGKKKRNQELPQYSQVGNAVPPLLAKGIAETILEALAS